MVDSTSTQRPGWDSLAIEDMAPTLDSILTAATEQWGAWRAEHPCPYANGESGAPWAPGITNEQGSAMEQADYDELERIIAELLPPDRRGEWLHIAADPRIWDHKSESMHEHVGGHVDEAIMILVDQFRIDFDREAVAS